MTRIVTPSTVDTSPAQSRPMLEAVKKQLGSVPNLFRVIGNSPAALEGYLGLSGALAKGRLDAKLRERIALRVAELNGCDYCLSAHTYLGRELAKLDDAELSSSREGRSSDARVEGALRFVTAIVQERGHVSDTALLDARSAGYDDAQLIEIVLHVAVNTLTNYVNSVAGTEVDFPLVAAHAAYGGLCAVAVSMGERVPSDATSRSHHGGRTFRFSSSEAKAMFDADPAGFVAKADTRWPELG
jgi:AhpD family alkylhydroperoxidase